MTLDEVITIIISDDSQTYSVPQNVLKSVLDSVLETITGFKSE